MLAGLKAQLDIATLGLPKVTGKKMFGCEALWADGSVFALVWKEGRIGLKLTDVAEFDALIKLPGAGPWKAGPMAMSHWVLVPEAMHTKSAELKKWAAKAHKSAPAAPKKK